MDFDEKLIAKTIKTDAKALGLPSGSTDVFIKKTLESVKKSLKNKTIITEGDLNRLIVRELKKYHADLAYVYKNRDKII